MLRNINEGVVYYMEVKRKFGLWTAISMIIGIVIGSGIFFKSHSVLEHTSGNVALGVLVFIIGAISIIFGSLALAELALRTNKKGGIVAYAEEALGRKGAIVFGWYQNFVYFPTVIAILAWVIGTYVALLFNLPETLELQMAIGIGCVFFFYILNYVSAKLAGIFQNLATLIKLIPIFIVAIVGLFFSQFDFSLFTNFTAPVTSTSWLAAIGPVAFIYDGWSIATNISHEIKDEKRNLPLALIIAPIFILVVYLMYFIGMSAIVGPATIIATGNAHVNIAMEMIFGAFGSRILFVIIIISIMGTANGMILGFTRSLYVLGSNKMVPYAQALEKISHRHNTPTFATLISCVIILFWAVVHYFTTKYSLLQNSDISEIAVVTMYLIYVVLYAHVIRLRRQGVITSNLRGYVVPVLAMVGSGIIFYGGMQNAMFLLYAVFSLLVILIAYVYALKTSSDARSVQ